MRSRPGNGSPASVASGSASAAASETAPRIPAHERKTPPRQLDMRPGEPLRRLQDDEHPREPHRDDREADERRVPEERPGGDALERVHDDGEL